MMEMDVIGRVLFVLPSQERCGVPVQFTMNVTESIWIQPRTGFIFHSVELVGSTDSRFEVAVPLGIEAGVTLPNNYDLAQLGLYASFEFPELIQSFGGNVISAEAWKITMGSQLYLGDPFP